MSLTDGMEDLGEDVTSNFDYEISATVVEQLRAAPGKVYGCHSAWDFHGRIWFDGSKFQEEVWQHHRPVDVVSAPTVEELRDIANDKWGSRMKSLPPSAMIPRPRRPIVDKMCAACPFNADRGRPKLDVSDDDMRGFEQQARVGEFYCHETVLGDPRTACDVDGDAVGVQPHFKVCRGAWEYKLAYIRDREEKAMTKAKTKVTAKASKGEGGDAEKRFEIWKKKAETYAKNINVIDSDLFTDEDLYEVNKEAKVAFDGGTDPKDFIQETFAEDIAEQDMYDDAVDQGWGAEDLNDE